MKKLSPEVSNFYELISIRPGAFNFDGFGFIDLTSINLKRADELFAAGFAFLKKKIQAQPVKEKPVLIIENTESKPYKKPPISNDLDKLRDNKRYINSLLSLNFSDLSFQEKAIFYQDEKFFFDKRNALFEISKIDAKMKSLHARLKLEETAELRKQSMKTLLYLESLKIKSFEIIDTWLHEEAPEETAIERAAREAVEQAFEIKTLTNYIGRFEKTILAMPETTEKLKEKKAKKLEEIEKRKQRLSELNAPYKRITRT